MFEPYLRISNHSNRFDSGNREGTEEVMAPSVGAINGAMKMPLILSLIMV